jgi:3-hydroxy-9,10-secoandrosta-1,3,5(10)-triene-9,17-dione monooxygenase
MLGVMTGASPLVAPLARTDALARARALAPGFRMRAAETEALRQLPRANLEELFDSRLFDIALPQRWGGAELGPDVWVDVIAEIAAACGSTGWVYGVLLGHVWLVSHFSLEAQREVFGKPNSLVASLIRLGGSVERVPGGYRWTGASGRFCSGVDHADWVVVGGAVQSEHGEPERRWFLIPRSDFTVEDDWFTTGLKGTGSKSIRVADVFVPEYRSILQADLDSGDSPGRVVNPGALYRLPSSTWTFVLPATPVGIARGAVAAARESLGQRLGKLPEEHVADQSATLERFARASTDVDIAYLLLKRQACRLMEAAERPLSLQERTEHRRDIAYAVQQARHAVNVLFELSGGSGIYESTDLQRMWRDVNAAAAHFGLGWEPAAIAYARASVGLPPAKSDRRAR